MEDPRLWGSTPFRNTTAWIDFTGRHELWHRALATKIATLTGTSVRIPPLGSGAGGDAWLNSLQQMYVEEYAALGLGAPPSLADVDLSDASSFASWTFNVSQAAQTLRVSAGLS